MCQFGRIVVGGEGGEAVEGVLALGDGEELAAGAVRPGVAEVEIGHGEQTVFFEIDCPAMIEPDLRQNFQAAPVHRKGQR